MKTFVNRLVLIGTLLVVLLIIAGFVRMRLIRCHSWKLPEKVHIMFMGASHVQHGIDDSMMESAFNWSRGSERYMYTYIKLKHLIPENPQVDTVFLELAPTDIWEDTDFKYYDLNEQSGFVSAYWPFFESENWKVVMKTPVQVIGLIIGSFRPFS